jgi:hypothetical protein
MAAVGGCGPGPALSAFEAGVLSEVGQGLCGITSLAANFVELFECELPRISIPRTPVNKGKEEGRGSPEGFEAGPSG